MATIGLITDFGLTDSFAGVIKAVISRIDPAINIIDVCHQVKPQDVFQAAFLLEGSYKYFPSGSIHLVVVDPGVGSKRKKILVVTRNYFFIAPDNGVLDLALKKEKLKKIINITNQKYFLRPTSDTFHARDIFAPVAAYLSKGVKPESFGRPLDSYKPLEMPKPKLKTNNLLGEIIYIDRFGNLISNIDRDTLINFIKNRNFKICIKGKIIDKLSHSYSGGHKLKPLALIDSFNYLEIAINSGSACDSLAVTRGTKIGVVKI